MELKDLLELGKTAGKSNDYKDIFTTAKVVSLLGDLFGILASIANSMDRIATAQEYKAGMKNEVMKD